MKIINGVNKDGILLNTNKSKQKKKKSRIKNSKKKFSDTKRKKKQQIISLVVTKFNKRIKSNRKWVA